MKDDKRYQLALLVIGLGMLAWSAWKPHDYFTWILEVFPAIVAAVVLTVIYRLHDQQLAALRATG